jgi:hypothetical protein
MNTPQSFTYTISSYQGIGTLCNDLYFDLQPLKENFDTYYVQCTGFCITSSLLVNQDSYYNVVVDDLAENGYFTGLRSNQAILTSFNTTTNVGMMTSGEGSHFIVKNMRMTRRIRIRLYRPSLVVVPDTQTPNGCYWILSLLFTPII